MSVASIAGSDVPAQDDAAEGADAETVGDEERLIDMVERLGEKRAESRIKTLTAMVSLLRCSVLHLPPTWSHLFTLTSGLERCARKGQGIERLDADELTQDMAEFKQLLLNILTDKSGAELRVRAAACSALALGTFVSPQTDSGRLSEMLANFEAIFSASGHKGDGSVPVHSSEVCDLHESAIDAWCLLFTFAGQDLVRAALQKQMRKFTEILESGDVDLRILAGRRVPAAAPAGPQKRQSISCQSTAPKVAPKLTGAASAPISGDIFAYITTGEFSNQEVKLKSRTSLARCWTTGRRTAKIRYHFFSQVLQQGTNTHMEQNSFVRQVFGLGPPGQCSRYPAADLAAAECRKLRRRCLLQANEKFLKRIATPNGLSGNCD
uniref:IFRD domain-containing protein n=1 Tax=Macrostomum lignano TaxID=282301 RepID=A0A1I8IRP0_9PLAT